MKIGGMKDLGTEKGRGKEREKQNVIGPVSENVREKEIRTGNGNGIENMTENGTENGKGSGKENGKEKENEKGKESGAGKETKKGNDRESGMTKREEEKNAGTREKMSVKKGPQEIVVKKGNQSEFVFLKRK